MKLFGFAVCLFAYVQPVQADRDITDELEYRGQRIVLENRSGRCFAVEQSSGHSLDMNISAPCKFLHRGGSPEVTIQRYKKIGAVVAVAGKPVSEAEIPQLKSRFPGIKAGMGCSTEMRGLIIPRKGKMYPSYQCFKLPQDAYCYSTGMDEKNYYSLAHHRYAQFQCD